MVIVNHGSLTTEAFSLCVFSQADAMVNSTRSNRLRPGARSNGHLRDRSNQHRRIVLIASTFNPSITQALVRGASDVLRQRGVPQRNIQLLWVPGAFELPVVAARIAQTRPRPDAIIALGALIKGDTPQYAVIAHAVASGLTQVSAQTRIPVTFGVIVATTLAQAKARAGGTEGNRGREAATAALSVLQMLKRVT